MPQSLSLVIVHRIFSTKERYPFLENKHHQDTCAYLATTAREVGCQCFRVGGTKDHVHLAIRLSRTLSIADLVKKLKTSSSQWLKTQSRSLNKFAWQSGYGCFSIGPKDLDALINYIDNQGQHHKKRSFQEEFRMFLERYGVEYDEAYVWD